MTDESIFGMIKIMKKNKGKSKSSPKPQKNKKQQDKRNIILIIIFLFLSVILFVLALQDHVDPRQRAANQNVTVDACQPSGGSCKPVGTCLSNETNLGQLDCSADNTLTCCKLANAVPTVPGDSDIDGSTCRSKGGYCQQQGFCQGGQGGGEEDCSNDGSNWCCMGPQQNAPTLPGPSLAPSSAVPSPGCLGSCPIPSPSTEVSTQPEPSNANPSITDPAEPSEDPNDEGQPGGGNGGSDQGIIAILIGFLLAILEFFLRLFGGGRN